MLGETASAFQPEANARGVEIQTNVPDDMPPADLDPVRVREVVMNLLVNAVRHSTEGGVVRIEDDVLITPGEPKMLSAGAPRTPMDIEAFMSAAGKR